MAYAVLPQAGVDLSTTGTTQIFPLGIEICGNDGATYVYIKAGGAIAQYAACKFDDTLNAVELTTTNAGSEPCTIVVPQVAFASGEYGWAACEGLFTVKAAASCVQDVKLYTTATAGVVDDSVTTLIVGLKIITTITGATSTPAYASTRMYCN